MPWVRPSSIQRPAVLKVTTPAEQGRQVSERRAGCASVRRREGSTPETHENCECADPGAGIRPRLVHREDLLGDASPQESTLFTQKSPTFYFHCDGMKSGNVEI